MRLLRMANVSSMLPIRQAPMRALLLLLQSTQLYHLLLHHLVLLQWQSPLRVQTGLRKLRE